MHLMESMKKIPRRRYYIFTLIMALALLNYVERGAISFASQNIMGEYGFDQAQWGALLGYFGYGYLFGAFLGGWSADKFGTKKVWCIAGGAWSLLVVATAYGGDLGIAVLGGSASLGFAVVRVLFGLAEGPAYSLINKSTSMWATPTERGFVLSVGLVSTPLGALLTAPVAVGLLTLTGSWRAMFIIIGVLSLVVLVYFQRLFTNRPEEGRFVSPEESAFIKAQREPDGHEASARADGDSVAWWTFFQNPALVLNAIGYFAFVYISFLLLTWMPKYLQDAFHYNLSSLWYIAMTPWIGPCFSVLLGGRLSDWLLRRTGSYRISRSLLAAACLLVTTVCFGMVSISTEVWQVLLLIAVANTLNAMANSVYWAIILDTAPSSRLGTFSGMTHTIANIAAVLAPTLTGIITLRHGYTAMFVAAAIASGIGMLAMILVKPGRRAPAPQVTSPASARA